ncbi:MAG: ATP-binding cassette domain-containing protein [Acetobacteraceae bacterium]|nr:ATP-binding cassette domain-containing protein [Acetobacteraceae bacterium]
MLRLAGMWLFAIAGLSLVCSIGALSVPLFNMQVFNRVLPSRDFSTLQSLTVGLALGLVFWTLLEWLRSVALELLATQVASRLSLPLIQSAAVVARPDLAAAEALADLETLRSFIASRSSMVPIDIALSPMMLVALFAMHWGLGLLGLASMAVLICMNLLGDALSRSAMLAANQSTATSIRGAADAVNAAEAVVGLGMLPHLVARWRANREETAALVHRALLRARAVSAVIAALRAAMTGATVGLGLVLALDGLMSSGSMVAGNMVLARLLMPFAGIAATRRQWVDTLAAWRRVRGALDLPTPHRNAAGLPTPEPRLVVENLGYVANGGDRALLRSISFEVAPGEAVALIGPSAAGKSTLLRLLVGMTAPTTGGVYLDGSNTHLWDREDLACHVGYVPQRPTLLDETVADNIARMQEPDLRLVVAAAKRVGMHEIIARLPLGYATRLSSQILSGGQRQRLALARALYGSPKVLLLDEPSAFLDAEGEAWLIECLGALKRAGVTIILATHRPPLLVLADKVVVLENGMVSRIGPTAEIQTELAPRVRLVEPAQAAV